jgi:hypothetical protein
VTTRQLLEKLAWARSQAFDNNDLELIGEMVVWPDHLVLDTSSRCQLTVPEQDLLGDRTASLSTARTAPTSTATTTHARPAAHHGQDFSRVGDQGRPGRFAAIRTAEADHYALDDCGNCDDALQPHDCDLHQPSLIPGEG